jgi:hypothetical protein
MGFFVVLIKFILGNSLAVQWLELQTSTEESTGSIPSWGTKILHATWCNQTKKFINKKVKATKKKKERKHV